MFAFFTALGMFAASVAVTDKRWSALLLLVGVAAWTVFVQDHMTWRKR